MSQPILTITQAARRLGISTRTIRIYEEEGFIRLEKAGGRRLVGWDQIESLLLIERIKSDLGVNTAGVGVILEMRRKIMELQTRIEEMENDFERRLSEALSAERRAQKTSLSPLGDRAVVKVIVQDD